MAVELRKEYEPGRNYYSPYKKPKTTPEGYGWVVAKRHEGKKYPTHWTLEPINPEYPSIDELPPVDEEGNVVEVFKSRKGVSSFRQTLSTPKDIGIPEWQKGDLED